MSSRPHVTPHAEKPSTPAGRPSGLETSATNYCPHCGGELGRSLAQHMARGICEQHTATVEQSREKEPCPEEYPDPPLLEEHDEREHVEDDLAERRRLADDLDEAGVWPGE